MSLQLLLAGFVLWLGFVLVIFTRFEGGIEDWEDFSAIVIGAVGIGTIAFWLVGAPLVSLLHYLNY